jgi:hypothetical protein
MKRSFLTSPLVLTLLLSIGSGSARAQTPNEVQGPVTILSPYTWWPSNPAAARFLETQVMHIGSNLYIYVGGGPFAPFVGTPPNFPGWDCSLGEKIMAFKVPFTFSGLRTQITSMSNYVGTVSPCNTSEPNVHYTLGGVFQSSWDGQYKMLLNETVNGTSFPSSFKRVILMTSPDGEHWSRVDTPVAPFIQQSTVNGQLVSITTPSVVQGTTNWWGFFQFGTACNCSTGRLRVTQAVSNPRGYVVSMLATDNTWHNVKDDGTFDFMPKDVEAGAPWTLLGPPLSYIVNSGGQYEVWAAANPPLTPTGGCNNGGHQTIAYGTTEDSDQPMHNLQSITSSVRAMPTFNGAGRLGAARINDAQGKMLVYGASTDRYCTQTGGGTGWKGAEILLTVVQ